MIPLFLPARSPPPRRDQAPPEGNRRRRKSGLRARLSRRIDGKRTCLDCLLGDPVSAEHKALTARPSPVGERLLDHLETQERFADNDFIAVLKKLTITGQ